MFTITQEVNRNPPCGITLATNPGWVGRQSDKKKEHFTEHPTCKGGIMYSAATHRGADARHEASNILRIHTA